MKNLKLYEDYRPHADYGSHLTGDDKKVFDAVEQFGEEFFNHEWFERRSDRSRIDPMITSIIDQNKGGGTHDFPPDKQYFVFFNNRDGKGYIEVETGIDMGGGRLVPVNPDGSSHGWPASYGEEMYSYDRKTGEIKYDREFFRWILR